MARNTRTLTFDLFAKNNTAKGLKSAAKDADAFGKRLGKIGAGIGLAFAAGSALLIKAGFDAVEALKRLEVIGAQTTAVITSTGGAAGVTAEHVRELADSLERTTASESEATQEGINLLLTFTNIRNGLNKNEKVLDRAAELMVDMARAMGKDAAGSAIQLGKALNDPVKGVSALAEAGVQFTDDQKNMIRALQESGDMFGAQQVILNELETQFGGSGAAYAATLAGQMDTLNNNIGATAESIVEKLMPDLQAALTWMNGDGLRMLEGFAEWFRTEGIGAIKGFADKIGELAEDGTLIPAVVAGLGAVTLAQLGLNAAMAANPVGLVIVGLAGLLALSAAVIANWNDVTRAIATATMPIVNGLMAVTLASARGIEAVINAVLRGLNAVLGPVNGLLDILGMAAIRLPQSVSFSAGMTSVAMDIQRLGNLAVGGGISGARNPGAAGGGSGGAYRAMARGGIVSATPGGVPAVVGEGAHDEAVIPLSRRSLDKYGLGGGGDTYNVTIQGFVGMDKDAAVRAIVKGIRDARKIGSISGNPRLA